MNIHLWGLDARSLPVSLLDRWERQPFTPGTLAGPGARDRRDSYQREVAQEKPGEPEIGGPHERVAAAIMRYEIFPPWMISGVLRRVPVREGDTVGILFHSPVGAKLFFAARAIEVFDSPGEGPTEKGQKGRLWRTGFTYRTLLGHPELGEETFAVEKELDTGIVRASLRSWSRPGTLLARTFAPVVRMLQVRASYAALDHLASIAASAARSQG